MQRRKLSAQLPKEVRASCVTRAYKHRNKQDRVFSIILMAHPVDK
jgi:hypothetical protein